MTRTCTNCGYVNVTADETSLICPNCGVPYAVTPDVPPDLPGLAATHASPFTIPSGSYLTPPPAVTAAGQPSAAPLAPSSRRRNLIIGVSVALLLMGMLGGGAIVFAAHQATTVAAIATATPTTVPAKATLYIDPLGQFTLKYPTEWVTQMATIPLNGGTVDLTRFGTPRGTEGMIVAVSKAPLTNGDAGALISHFGGTGYQTQGSPTTLKAKSGEWQAIVGTFTFKAQMAGCFARSAQQSGLQYLVIGFGPAQPFAGQLLKTLNLMFASLSLAAGA
ncbi:MAG: hypothetical protein H0X24_09405 [Ktedonobacterales bacterium]|nr:hypothetical protein [Ktedonobacterales bacterium]